MHPQEKLHVGIGHLIYGRNVLLATGVRAEHLLVVEVSFDIYRNLKILQYEKLLCWIFS